MNISKELPRCFARVSDLESTYDKINYLLSHKIKPSHIKRWLGLTHKEYNDYRPATKSKPQRYNAEYQKQYRLKRRKTIETILVNKVNKFKLKKNIPIINNYSYKDVLIKFGEKPICYLTGRQIDYLDSKSYHLDHIIAVSRGGTNELDNMQISCSHANIAKNIFNKDELIKLCKDILLFNGYKVLFH